MHSPHTPTGPYCAPLFNSSNGRYSNSGQGFPLRTPIPEAHRQNGALRTLIQEQQLLLEKILNNQKTLETQQAALDERLFKIESSSVSSSNSEPGHVAKKKRLVTHTLSVSFLPITTNPKIVTTQSLLNVWRGNNCTCTLNLCMIQVKVQTIHNALEEQFQADQRQE